MSRGGNADRRVERVELDAVDRVPTVPFSHPSPDAQEGNRLDEGSLKKWPAFQPVASSSLVTGTGRPPSADS
jgi:hypothetical protein